MASERQMNRLLGLRAVKMADQPTNRPAHQPTTPTNKMKQWSTRAEHSRLKSGPPLMSEPGINENITVSDIKLQLALRVGFISSHLTADKLSQLSWERSRVHRRSAFCFRPKARLHWSSNQGLPLLCTWMTFVGTQRPTSRCSFEPSTALSTYQMLHQSRSYIAP